MLKLIIFYTLSGILLSWVHSNLSFLQTSRLADHVIGFLTTIKIVFDYRIACNDKRNYLQILVTCFIVRMQKTYFLNFIFGKFATRYDYIIGMSINAIIAILIANRNVISFSRLQSLYRKPHIKWIIYMGAYISDAQTFNLIIKNIVYEPKFTIFGVAPIVVTTYSAISPTILLNTARIIAGD